MIKQQQHTSALFEPERHEALNAHAWNYAKTKAVLNEIYERALGTFDIDRLWLYEGQSYTNFYDGAAGIVWGLDKLSQYLKKPLILSGLSKTELMVQIYQRYQKKPDTGEIVPSYFLGEVGLILYLYKLTGEKSYADLVHTAIEQNIENPTLEALWGAPGTMLAANFMYQWTREARWAALYVANAQYLIETLKRHVNLGDRIWIQDLYDSKVQYIGAGHGYFGNVFGLLSGFELLDNDDQRFLINHISATFKSMAMYNHEKTWVNWPALLTNKPEKRVAVQWCHGAPGVITSMAMFPKHEDADIEEMLGMAGQLVWGAGPLTKGVGICHGTDGNALAFLQLYHRTQQEHWLEKARAFAMHAMNQRCESLALYTGELGFAQVLMACINKENGFPILNNF